MAGLLLREMGAIYRCWEFSLLLTVEELAPTDSLLGVWGESAGEQEGRGVNSPESLAVPPGTQLSLPTASPVKVKFWELPP